MVEGEHKSTRCGQIYSGIEKSFFSIVFKTMNFNHYIHFRVNKNFQINFAQMFKKV